MSASRPSTMRGPRGNTPPLVFLLLLWLLYGTWTGTDGAADQESEMPAEETEDAEKVVEGDTDVLAEPTLSPPDVPPTLDPPPTQEGGTDSEWIGTQDKAEDLGSGEDSPASTEDMNYADSTLSPLEDEGLSLPIIVIPVALVVFIIATIVLGLFLKRRLSKEAANQDSRKDDPYLDGSSMEKVPMPMFEEDVPSVLELEMDELDQWMKNDG
ncbi:transmembrane protein 154 isoform X2 [Dunckerocampus dactyliophorus]|uniref:transmembrane protein 154 isoform X2 n=1 Tax=Dunckerocampus dactyliophorus TaxID=161453 RepID=UPI002405E31A|nr:transmembrane protein 154 isoform X2 [Dunckerocampus dactyliophorus]